MCVRALQDAAALRRFLQKEDVRELPADEERWEVPEPLTPEVILERGTESHIHCCTALI